MSRYYTPITRNFNIPRPGQTPGIWTFENWIVQIPAPSGQNRVQMPYPIVGFVCEIGHPLRTIFVGSCRYNLKSLAFKHSLLLIHALKALHNFWRPFFVSQSLTNVLSLPLNSSISSKHVVIAISDFGARKRKSLEAWHFWFNFPHPTQVKVKFPTPRAQEMVKCLGFALGEGMLKFRFDRCTTAIFH